MTVKKICGVGSRVEDFEFDESQPIGSGASAEVFKAKTTLFDNPYFYALKRIRKSHDGRKAERVENEIRIHSQLKHPTIVQFRGSFECEKYWYIVLELCEGGSLQEYIKRKKKGKLSVKETCKFIKQVFEGVQYLYSRNIIHRDLSLKNLLLTKDNEVKIADFGLAKSIEVMERKTSIVGTINFMAPEVFDGCYNFKSDLWSVGCVLYTLLYGTPPFHAEKKGDIKMHIKRCEFSFPDGANIKGIKKANDLIMAMLQKKANDRIGIRDALNHDFVKMYEKSNTILKTNKSKNGDSGNGSLSNSSPSPHIQKVGNSDNRESTNRSIHNEHISNSGHLDNYARYVNQSNSNSMLKIKRNCSSFHMSNGNHLNNEKQILSSSKMSHNPISSSQKNPKSRECRTLQELNEINSQMHSFNGCVTSTKIEDVRKNLSHSRGFCSPEVISVHASNNSCQPFCTSVHTRSNSFLFRTNEKESKIMKNTLTPLTTVRLKNRRRRVSKNAFVSILNGEVWLEILKLEGDKEHVYRVYFISGDGMTINIFRPKEEPLDLSNEPPSVNKIKKIRSFALENLPEVHWNNYGRAKQFVDKVRAITAKIVIAGKFAECIMMENTPDPDYEVNFYEGYQITKVGHKITIRNKSDCEFVEYQITEVGHKKTIKNESIYEIENGSNIQFMLNVYENMKKACENLERCIISWQEGFSFFVDTNFPIKLGTKPGCNKENTTSRNMYSPSLNRTLASKKSFDNSKLVDNISTQNCSQKNLSSSSSSRKNTTTSSRKNAEIMSNLEECKLKKSYDNSKFVDSISYHNSTQKSQSSSSSSKRIATKPSRKKAGNISDFEKCQLVKSLDTSNHNSIQKSLTSSSSSKRNTPSREKAEIMSGLKKYHYEEKDWVVKQYNDGIEMWISIKDGDYFFWNVNSQEKIPVSRLPDLKDYYNCDSLSILHHIRKMS